MSLKVKLVGPDGSKSPPGGFTCYLPQLKKVYGPTPQFHLIRGWVKKAMTKLAEGAEPDVAVVEQMIHTHTAARLKREGHTDWVEGTAVVPVRRKRTMAERWKGTLAYAKVVELDLRGQSVLTIPKEAERRAKICTSGGKLGLPCPMNVETVEGNLLEQKEEAIMAERVDDRTTSLDTELHVCNACSCQLKTIVHLTSEVLLVGLEPDKYPPFCWKLKLKAVS